MCVLVAHPNVDMAAQDKVVVWDFQVINSKQKNQLKDMKKAFFYTFCSLAVLTSLYTLYKLGTEGLNKQTIALVLRCLFMMFIALMIAPANTKEQEENREKKGLSFIIVLFIIIVGMLFASCNSKSGHITEIPIYRVKVIENGTISFVRDPLRILQEADTIWLDMEKHIVNDNDSFAMKAVVLKNIKHE